MSSDLKKHISDIPDFPKPGITFRDISPLLNSPEAFRHAVAGMAAHVSSANVSSIVAIESRGFLFAAPIAHHLGVPLVLVRKPGKLPGEITRIEYGLEYGSDALEIKSGLLPAGARVAVIDDVLATGGTACATRQLVTKVGAHASLYVFLVELTALEGRRKLEGASVSSLIQY